MPKYSYEQWDFSFWPSHKYFNHFFSYIFAHLLTIANSEAHMFRPPTLTNWFEVKDTKHVMLLQYFKRRSLHARYINGFPSGNCLWLIFFTHTHTHRPSQCMKGEHKSSYALWVSKRALHFPKSWVLLWYTWFWWKL